MSAMTDAAVIWADCLAGVAPKVAADDLETWLRPIHPAWDGDTLMLFASNVFIVDEIRRNYLALLAPHLPEKFRLLVGSREDAARGAQALPANPPPAPESPAPPRPAPSASGELMPAWWPDEFVALPSAWLRSALFTANAYGDDTPRPRRERMKVAAQSDIHVYVTGEELNQGDREVMAWLLEYQKNHPIAGGFRFSASEMLADLGQAKNGAATARLRASITRLRRTSCEISIHRKNGATLHFSDFNFVDEFVIDERAARAGGKSWFVRISPRVAQQFAGDGYTRLDYEVSRKAQGQLGKWLHGYFSSHGTPFPVSVEFLHRLSGSQIKELRRFRDKLKDALDSLVEAGFLQSWKLEGDLVHVRRAGQLVRST